MHLTVVPQERHLDLSALCYPHNFGKEPKCGRRSRRRRGTCLDALTRSPAVALWYLPRLHPNLGDKPSSVLLGTEEAVNAIYAIADNPDKIIGDGSD